MNARWLLAKVITNDVAEKSKFTAAQFVDCGKDGSGLQLYLGLHPVKPHNHVI